MPHFHSSYPPVKETTWVMTIIASAKVVQAPLRTEKDGRGWSLALMDGELPDRTRASTQGSGRGRMPMFATMPTSRHA